MINRFGEKKNKSVTPVVTAKPVRGREMISKTVPTTAFEPTRSLSPERPPMEEEKGEVYHEGYIDGKLFLVPDSNLEAMKDIVNFKMRPRRSIRYKHQTSYEISDYDHFRSKLGNLLDKINDMSSEEHSESEQGFKEKGTKEELDNIEEKESTEEYDEANEEEGGDEKKPEQKHGESTGESEEDKDIEEGKKSILSEQSSVGSEKVRDDEGRLSKNGNKSGEESKKEEDDENIPIEEVIKGERFVPVKEVPTSEYDVRKGSDAKSEAESQGDSEAESKGDSEGEHETKPKGTSKQNYGSNTEATEGTKTESMPELESDSEAESEKMPEPKVKGTSKSDDSGNKYIDGDRGKSGNIKGSEIKSDRGSRAGVKTKLSPESNQEYRTKPGDIPDHTTKLSKEKRITPVESDRSYIRLLISGHFKTGKRPIYIIQEYNGDSLFKDQNTDIFTSEKNGDIDILITGKYYDENILEEIHGKPVALNTKPNKIIIDENRSEVYEDYFENVINMKTADILVKGQFITNEITKKVTPLIRFGVKRKSP